MKNALLNVEKIYENMCPGMTRSNDSIKIPFILKSPQYHFLRKKLFQM